MREKRVTVRDVAKEAGVSIATVSRFLNQDFSSMSESTKQRIHQVVRDSGYVHTQKAKAHRSVAIVMPNIIDPYFAMMVEALTAQLEKVGITSQLCLTRDSIEQEERSIRSILASSSVSGALCMSTVTSEKNYYGLLKNAGKPFAVLDSYLSECNVPGLVFCNGVLGMCDVTKYLLSLGHQNIAYLSGMRHAIFENYRYQGYVNALLGSGLTVNPRLVRFVGFGVEDGMAGFRDLRASGESFTAIICESDQMAAGVYKACAQDGISIPEELSVVGFNNSPVATLLEPELTSVDQQVDLLAEKAVQMLCQQMQGDPVADRVQTVPPKLVIRNSVRDLLQVPGKDQL